MAWIDNSSLRTYRTCSKYGPHVNHGAAGDATKTAVFILQWLPSKRWNGLSNSIICARMGFKMYYSKTKLKISKTLEVICNGKCIIKSCHINSRIHAQTAARMCSEVAIRKFKGEIRWNWTVFTITTFMKSAIRIFDKEGPLNNPADRDHCLQTFRQFGLLKEIRCRTIMKMQ